MRGGQSAGDRGAAAAAAAAGGPRAEPGQEPADADPAGPAAGALQAIAAYDAEISRLFLLHADSAVFASLPRAAKRLAPRLLAEWGDDRGRYADVASIQALAGTAPVPFASGKFVTVHRRLACNKPLRNVLQQFAWQSTQKEAWAAAYYQEKRQAGKSHSMALRALANQWVRIIYALWRKQEAYDPSVFRAAQHAHGHRAA